MLPRGRVVDSAAAIKCSGRRARVPDGGRVPDSPGEEEETIAGSRQIEGLVKPGDGVELGGPVVEGEDVMGCIAVENREDGLVGVMGEEEAAGGGGAAPRAADGAGAEEGFGVEADEDLPEDDLIWEAVEERRRCCCRGLLRHGRRLRLGVVLVWVVAAAEGRSGCRSFGRVEMDETQT
jgi:hypothetical protein